MTEPSQAVFLSYASQDAQAAQRICEALRASGIEIWFDQSALRGGDAWDAAIRKQIKSCALFIPIISRNTHARGEGYFRLEWKLAVDRSHLMASDLPFLVPVVIDDTPDTGDRIPERFREIQWTRLPSGETPPAFVERVQRLLSPEPSATIRAPASAPSRAVGVIRAPAPAAWSPKRGLPVAVGVLVLGVVAFLAIARPWISRPAVSSPTVAASASPAAVSPPPHSIAVLPLVNESGEASQQYFSDGMSEDLITALGQFPGLKVIGRTSSFQFRDSKEDSRSIGAKLGVVHLLEGSVRKSGNMIRVSTELIDTTDGSMQWSEHYDRPYKDLFALQDEITRAVTGALQAKLLPGEHAAEQGDRPPAGSLESYNAYLQGRFYYFRETEADYRKAIDFYIQATHLDPHYAVAWSWLAVAWTDLAAQFLEGVKAQEAYAEAREAADHALAVAPDLAVAHVARGYLLANSDLDWRGAEAEYRRAQTLAPNDADANAKLVFGNLLATFGKVEPAIEMTRQVLATDPLSADAYVWLAFYLSSLHRLDEAEQAARRAIELQPAAADYHLELTVIEIQRGNAQAALATAQQEPPGPFQDIALALAQQIGGDRSVADAALSALIEKNAGTSAYQIAEVYALRNDAKGTFEWLDRAWSNRDAGIRLLLYDPLILRYKGDQRFAAFCRKVALPVPGEVRQQT